jgi:hypothetical protein
VGKHGSEQSNGELNVSAIALRRGQDGLTGKNEDSANGDDYRAQALDHEQL